MSKINVERVMFILMFVFSLLTLLVVIQTLLQVNTVRLMSIDAENKAVVEEAIIEPAEEATPEATPEIKVVKKVKATVEPTPEIK